MKILSNCLHKKGIKLIIILVFRWEVVENEYWGKSNNVSKAKTKLLLFIEGGKLDIESVLTEPRAVEIGINE